MFRKRSLFYFALFALVLLQGVRPCSADAVSTKDSVRGLAQEYGLFDPLPTSYHFGEKDVTYWTQRNLPETELRKQFEAREVVRQIAEDMGYSITTVTGDKTPGVLSYWAERYLWNVDRGQIEHEFGELLKLGGTADRNLENSEALRDGIKIRKLAEKHGLFDENPFAWTFTEGDIVWYVYQSMSESQIEKELSAKQKVRELARETGFYLKNPAGRINAGELSYWADFLIDGNMSADHMKKFFLKKAALQK